MWDELSAHERKKALQALIESKGWRLLKAVLEDGVKIRTDEVILKPSSEFEGGYPALEFMKGEIAGIRAVLAQPEALLEVVVEEVKNLAEKEVEDDEDLADTRSNAGSDFDEDSDSWTS